jgi:hypothetical protein
MRTLLEEAIEEVGEDVTDQKNWLGLWSIINVALLQGDPKVRVRLTILKIMDEMWDKERKHLIKERII